MPPLVLLEGSEGKDDKAKVAAKSLCSSKTAVEKYMSSLKEYFDCTICCETLDRPTQTQCGHVFCEKCLKSLSNQTSSSCPLCKKSLSNRSLILREDVEDMANVVNKLANTFTTEFQEYLEDKQRRSRMSVLAKKMKDAGKNEMEKSELDRAQVESHLSKKSTIKSTKENFERKRKKPEEIVNNKKAIPPEITQAKNKDEIVKVVTVTSKSDRTVKKNQVGVSVTTRKDKPTTSAAKFDPTVNPEMNRKYKIMTADAIPLPLDLSMPSDRSEQRYHFKTAIEYVTPLDLSLKKEKRKFDETDSTPVEDVVQTNLVSSARETNESGPLHKRGKFADHREKEKNNSLSSSRKSGTSIEQAKRPKDISSMMTDFENRYDDDDSVSPIAEIPVFTPTPPSAETCRPPKNLTKCVAVSETVSPKPTITTPRRNIGITQSNMDLASEIMRDFDLPFGDEEDVHASSSRSSGQAITCSDELLGNITDESLLSSKRKSQTKSPPINEAPHTRTKQDAFVFKQPSKCISQAPSKKAKDDQNKRNDMMDFDDEFQQPRDSDLLFLNLSMTGGTGGNSPVSDNEKEKSGKNIKGLRQLSDSDALNKSQSASSNPSPVNTKHNQHKMKPTGEDRAQKRKSQVEDNMFEDDDEDWLRHIPEPSGKQSSGKSKICRMRSSSVTAEDEDTAVAPMPPKKQQRYVFCPTRLSKSHMAKLQQVCKMCDGVIMRDFTEDVTHLVINLSNGRVPQTLKYLLAIAGRKWVVIYEWIEKCVESGELVSESEFETSNFQHCDPGVRRSRLSEKNLFDGYKFYFASEIYKSLGFTKADVLMLMGSLGATVVNLAENRYRDLVIIGSLNGNSTEYNDWLLTNKWVTVTFDWVIECILEYRLKPFEPKHVCVDTTKVKSINAPKEFKDALTQYLTQRLSVSPRTPI